MGAKQCDVCGMFYNLIRGCESRPKCMGKRIYMVHTACGDKDLLKSYDLCVDCSKKLMAFLSNAEKEKPDDNISD